MRKKKDIRQSDETNSTVDDRLRRNQLGCSFCKPHRHENAGRKPKHGVKKSKSKNKRRQ